jgi:HlyD family secretion protein
MDRKIEKKKWPPKKLALYGGTGLFVFLVAYIFIFGDQSSKLNVEKERLTISDVRKGPFQEFIPITGEVRPIETFFLDVSDGGRVVKKFVEDGAFVNAGDPIVKLDNTSITLNMMYNEAQLFQQINSLRSTRLSMEQNRLTLQENMLEVEYDLLDAQRQYEVNKKLFEKSLISGNDFQKSKEQYDLMVNKKKLTYESFKQDSLFRLQQIEQLEASVAQMQGNMNIVKQQLENLTVKAPIKGQLTALNAEIGESISSGENLGQIDVVDSFKIRAQIDEHYIARVAPGQTGEFEFSGKTYKLIIKTVYPQVNNGRFEVDMHFAETPPQGIRRGQTVHIKLELGELTEALLVDRGGFYQTTGGQWVFVVDPSGKFAVKRNIRLGQQNPQVFEVLEGLHPGEKVITSSYDNFGDVQKLILK